MTDYRIGQPLAEGQNPLRVHHRLDGKTSVSVYHPETGNVCGVDMTSDIWPDHIAPAIAALNKHIAGWPVGPFSVDDVKAAA